jgi:SAM-dependent MidA family methyltransferase
MSRSILPEPPDELKRLSEELSARMREEIAATGAMPFARFMERALYEPGLGYYSAGLHKLGAAGDFVTAPEIGGLFATCLAAQVAEVGAALGPYDILEVGAGTGRLACGLLEELGSSCPPRRYLVLETSADLRAVQRERIRREAPGWLDRVEWLDAPPDVAWHGVLIANEVIDALPVERFVAGTAGIEQLCVTATADGFDWSQRAAPPALAAAVNGLQDELGCRFEPGYRSEIQLQLAPWLAVLTAGLERGLALFVDYGYPRAEYYRAERRDGTLMCHYRHRAHTDPFVWPGLQDLTSWVDFTALATAGEDCGLELEGYCTQALFLLGCGLDRLLPGRVAASGDGGMALNAEARQLTLPGMMGERFQVMGLGRGLDWAVGQPCGFSLQDLRYRL